MRQSAVRRQRRGGVAVAKWRHRALGRRRHSDAARQWCSCGVRSVGALVAQRWHGGAAVVWREGRVAQWRSGGVAVARTGPRRQFQKAGRRVRRQRARPEGKGNGSRRQWKLVPKAMKIGPEGNENWSRRQWMSRRQWKLAPKAMSSAFDRRNWEVEGLWKGPNLALRALESGRTSPLRAGREPACELALGWQIVTDCGEWSLKRYLGNLGIFRYFERAHRNQNLISES